MPTNPILHLLHQRASVPAKFLTEPAPDEQAVADIVRAALTAPDHGALRPWRFMRIQGSARNELGELFAQAQRAQHPDTTAEQLAAIRAKPLRAPLLLLSIVKLREDLPKIPIDEQIASTAAATQHMQLAANALGFSSVWLTGQLFHQSIVKTGLGLANQERVVGCLYIGHSTIPEPSPTRPDLASFLIDWSGPQ